MEGVEQRGAVVLFIAHAIAVRVQCSVARIGIPVFDTIAVRVQGAFAALVTLRRVGGRLAHESLVCLPEKTRAALDIVRDAVAVDVVVAGIAHAIDIHVALSRIPDGAAVVLSIEDAIAVRVGVEIVGHAIAIRVDG